MKLDLGTLKSAVVIDDPEKAFFLLSERVKAEAASPIGQKGHTQVARRKDGTVVLSKASGALGLGEGAPANPSKEEIQRLAVQRGLMWDKAYLDRGQAWWASDERVDGHGDIVRQNWLFNEFEKNPIMPYGHDWSGLPVGKHIDWRVVERRAADYTGPGLWLFGLFAMGDEGWQKPESVMRLVKGGLLPGGSVGFWSGKVIDIKDEEERKKLGLGRWGYILDENHLLEFSPVAIGANPGALAIYSNAMKSGLLQPQDFSVIRECNRRTILRSGTEGDKEAWNETERTVLATAKLLFPKAEFLPHKELDRPFDGEELEARVLKGYVPPPAPEDKCCGDKKEKKLEEEVAELRGEVATLRKELASTTSMIETVCAGMTQILEDIREKVEDLADGVVEDKGDGKERREGEEVSEGGPKKNSSRGALLLSALRTFEKGRKNA